MAAALARRKAEIVELTEQAEASRNRWREVRPRYWQTLAFQTECDKGYEECRDLERSIIRVGYLIKMQEAYLAAAEAAVGGPASTGADAN